MLDFLLFDEERKVDKRTGETTIYISPEFKVRASKDLMIRGSDFYAVWDESSGFWSTNEDVALSLIDNEIELYSEQCKLKHPDCKIVPMFTYKSKSGIVDQWHKYVQKQMRDHYHEMDENIIFAGSKPKKTDYASRQLSYPLEKGDISAYDELFSTLYSPEERQKIEWAIGAIVTGDSKKIQKFLVLYGSAGTGKSTILNIIQELFDGYYSVFDAKALASATNVFALDSFRNNPLVAIQHDGDLSRIEDNTRLNSIVSHERMQINEKFKSTYEAKLNCFLFMGTNKPVKITDAKSGIIRRLIDVSPTGNKIPMKRYLNLMSQIKFELGAIAYHCKEVYLSNTNAYDSYVPTSMIGATNDMYNFVEENYFDFKDAEYVTLNEAYKRYSEYCSDSKVGYPLSKRAFKEELKNYFSTFKDRAHFGDASQVWNVYMDFKTNKFEIEPKEKKDISEPPMQASWLSFNSTTSNFDLIAKDYISQYANPDGTPLKKWDNVKTKLKDLDTSKLHYVMVPENHIVIDFDIKDESGNKSYEKNLAEASKWPKTYAELSKSEAGIHLHYIYEGDPTKLSRVYDENIEIKVYTGNASLRRILTKCNDIPISSISSGLPLKGDSKMVNWDGIKSEKQIRTMIIKNLNKEYHAATKPSIDYIHKILEDAYNSGIKYDVSDLMQSVLIFATNSSHNSDYCVKLVQKMKFKSEEHSDQTESLNDRIVFYDIEVFPNLFLVNWKYEDSEQCVRMINPTSSEIEELCKNKLVGFNNRRYDNHILYARMMGYNNLQIYNLSQDIVNGRSNALFGEAYNLSYTDVYDFCSKKQSLKKWEIELGIHHQELGLPWDQPVPEDRWVEVAEYCDNDVIATEAVWKARKADFEARQILADVAGMSVNDTTNSLTTRIIFGNNREPQSQFNYRDLSKPVGSDQYPLYLEKFGKDHVFRVFNEEGVPQYRDYIPGEVLPKGWSILPFFPGYTFDAGKSTYLGEEIGEGGRVYSEPGMYANVLADDISSQHPHSIIAECAFGPTYTKRFEEIVQTRIAAKHNDLEAARSLLNGEMAKYMGDSQSSKNLAQALKIAINSVYGLTSASFKNPFRDPRNIDNIVAKRGALFMTLLKREVQKQGYKVCHIKTDCIKVPNYTNDIHEFITKFGKEFGYSFEIEAIYSKFALVNDAVYIAKSAWGDHMGQWTATGTQFQIPYVFKTLFSHEPIEFEDMCETKSVATGNSALYLDMNENLPEGEHNYIFIGKVGNFCPVKPGSGGGILYREKDGKYSAATGTKGYRWLESENVRLMEKFDDVDKSYYIKLVDDAVTTLSTFGDFEWFVSDDTEDNTVCGLPLPF